MMNGFEWCGVDDCTCFKGRKEGVKEGEKERYDHLVDWIGYTIFFIGG